MTAALPHFRGLFDSSVFFVCGTNWEILYFIVVSRYNNGKCITEMGEFTLELGLLDFGASYTVVITNVSVSVMVTSSFCSSLWQCFCSNVCDSHLLSAPCETWAVTVWRQSIIQGQIKRFDTYISEVGGYSFHFTLWSCQISRVKQGVRSFPWWRSSVENHVICGLCWSHASLVQLTLTHHTAKDYYCLPRACCLWNTVSGGTSLLKNSAETVCCVLAFNLPVFQDLWIVHGGKRDKLLREEAGEMDHLFSLLSLSVQLIWSLT